MNFLATRALLAQGTDAVGDVASRTMEAATTAGQAATSTFSEAFQPIVRMAPRALAAAVMLLIGFVAAKLLGRLVAGLCDKIGLQSAAERTGLAESMQGAGIRRNLPGIVGLVVFWLLLSVAIMASFRVLELDLVSEAMQGVVLFIPKILVAMAVVVIGLLVASFLRGLVATAANRVGISYAEHLAAGCYWALAVITFLAAADHLGLRVELLQTLILIGFSSLAVGFALAFGLGGREVLGGILAGYYIRQRFASGDVVRVAGMEGTVREVGPVATVIETQEEGLLHRHSVPNPVMLREGIR